MIRWSSHSSVAWPVRRLPLRRQPPLQLWAACPKLHDRGWSARAGTRANGPEAEVAEVAERTQKAEKVEETEEQQPVAVPVTKPMEFPTIKRTDPLLRPWMGGFANPEESVRSRWSRRVLRAIFGSAAGLLVWDVYRKEWSDRHSWSSAFAQYFLFRLMTCAGRWRLAVFLKEVEDGEAVQRKLLAEVIAGHQSTTYGRQHGLVGISSFEEFRRAQSITKRVDNANNVADMHISEISFLRGTCVAFGVLENEFPKFVYNLQRSGRLTSLASRKHLPSEAEIGSNSSLPSDPAFQKLACSYASPLTVYQIRNEPDALYAHALFALKDRNLGMLEADCVTKLCLLLDTAREKRRSLVQDMRNGHIWDRRRIAKSENLEMREAIDAELCGPGPKRAAEVEKLLREGAPAEKIWPNLRLVMAVDDGTFATSATRLQKLLGDSIEIYSPFYIAPEGLLGVNVTPKRPFDVSTFVLDPGSMVFELLPVEWRDAEQPPSCATILPWEAKIGEAYELVITTRDGLCRQRLHNVVRIHGRLGQMPIVSVEERATMVQRAV